MGEYCGHHCRLRTFIGVIDYYLSQLSSVQSILFLPWCLRGLLDHLLFTETSPGARMLFLLFLSEECGALGVQCHCFGIFVLHLYNFVLNNP
ncbi:hypothetical protein P167DRAFT_250254 [Morchella conica CCBAS932]|uniref:Uncharacterized protein n=1 Tax=Morchella conica CCBAS932 TaxID=1392247 RepID=A0A3N4KJ68_9PEZI|nr:hypothetical protein P167DRAFT_250254 [Morchella conica CCBAS932]